MTSAATPTAAARVLTVATPHGPARAHVHEAHGRRTRATVVLGHGAGGGVEAVDLVALADALPRHGHRVVLVEQPWRVAGRRVAAPPPTLDRGWLAVLDALRADGSVGRSDEPLVVGGRSAGARVACRTAGPAGAVGVVALAFPLHPPGRPERSRAAEAVAVAEAGAGLLVVQGGRDPFGTPAEVTADVPGARVVAVPGADHGFAVPVRSGVCTRTEALELIAGAVLRSLAEWCAEGGR